MARDTETLMDPPTLIQVSGLRKCYPRRSSLPNGPKEVRALDDVDLEIRVGSTLALVGASGAGKSTLARCLAGLERPDAGDIWFDSRRILELRGGELFALRREIQMIMQDSASA